jgi:hypothetical protein
VIGSTPDWVRTVIPMELLAAKVWTYWISFVLVGSAVLAALGFAVLYLIRVSSARYPKR